MMDVEEEHSGTDEEDMDTDSSLESGTCRISFRIRVAPDDSKKQVSVLMLTPQWRFDEYGMATITRSLIQNLRMIDPDGRFIKITCAVLEENRKISRNQTDVEQLKVQLVGYSRPRGDRREPELHWLDSDLTKYYAGITNHDFIIGHVPYLTYGCLTLKDTFVERGQACTAILVVHELLRNESGEIDEDQLRELADSGVLLSMEASIQEELMRTVVSQDQENTPEFKMYFPVFPVKPFKFEHQKKTESGGPRKMLLMTKERKDLKVDGLDLQLVVNSIAEANKKTNAEMTLTMLTEKNEKEEWESEGNFQCEVVEEVEDMEYHLKTSDLFLLPLKVSSPLFGSDALSAIAAGVPVLVSRHSPMGSLLLGMKANSSVVSEKDVATWGHSISRIIDNPDAAEIEAKNLRDCLLKDTNIPSSHMDFINIITGIFIKDFY